MPFSHSVFRVLLAVLMLLPAVASAADENQPPRFTSAPYPVADIGHDYRYDAEATDPEGGTLRFGLLVAPDGAALDPESGSFTWTPRDNQAGMHPLAIAVQDPEGAGAEQHAELRVLEDFCPIYPITLPRSVVEPLSPGAQVDGMERGTGPGNFSWLTWAGAVNAPTLAQSLLPPGDSWTYVGPTDPADTLLEVGDWSQGATGSMNAMAVRTNLDALLGEDIILPVWEDLRRQGSNFDYLVWRFAVVRLTDYRLTGNGWISFEFRGYANCYNDPPIAHDQAVETLEDTPLPITLTGEDRDGDAITFELLSQPGHGTLAGDLPALTYTPDENYNGADSFTFRVHDGEFWSKPATVAIVVLPVNDPPMAEDRAYVTGQGIPVQTALVASDVDGDTLVYRVVRGPANGTLGDEAPNLSYAPAPSFHGEDDFLYVASDGQADSNVATVAITVIRTNEPPRIVSPPLTVTPERPNYLYDVDAVDPDDDVLAYSLDLAPPGASIDVATGMIDWAPDPQVVQPTPRFNSQCYIIPEGLEDEGQGGFIAPLYQRVRKAISRGSDYAGPQTVTWDRRNGCLGCHVQTQTLLGLQASMEKASVDEEAAEYLLAGVLSSQLSDGSIRRSNPREPKAQTGYALWALSYVPDRDRTFETRRRALDFFFARRSSSGDRVYWNSDYNGAWIRDADTMTAVVALGASRYAADAEHRPDLTPAQLATLINFRGIATGIARFQLQRLTTSDSYTMILAQRMIGLAEVRALVEDEALLAQVDAAIASLDSKLRERQRPDGGWAYRAGGSASDPFTSAWVGFALDVLRPPLTDAAVHANIEYLLQTQRTDGTWVTNSGLFTTRLAATGFVIAYLPIALEFLGNPDLALSHVRLDDQADASVLTADVLNRGLGDITVPLRLTFYDGTPGSGMVLGSAELASLDSGQTAPISLQLDPGLPLGDVYVTVEATPETPECMVDNNWTRAVQFQARATDPFGGFDTQRYLLNVEDVNDAPSIVSEPATTLLQGLPYEHVVLAEDPDGGDALLFELMAGPDGLFLNPRTGKFSYSLAQLAVGTHPVTVRVTDLRGLYVEQAFQLTVVANGVPTITSTPPLAATLDQPYHYTVAASDPDGDGISYVLDASPLTMSLDADTGVVSWTPEARHLGPQLVRIHAEDGRGGIGVQEFTVQVTANEAPQFISTPTVVASVGSAYAYQVTVVDPDSDGVTVTLEQGPVGMDLDADNLLTWVPTSDQLGTRQVALVADDGRGGTARQDFSIEVLPPNSPPVFDSAPGTHAVVGQLYQFQLLASDPDGDAVSFALLQGPAGMSLNAGSGALAWIPTVEQVGTHGVRIEAHDGRGGSAQLVFDIVAREPAPDNQPPTLSGNPAGSGVVGRPYAYAPGAGDPDGDVLAFSLVEAPAGMVVDIATGAISWTPAVTGTFAVTLRVDDGRGGWAQQQWSITVIEDGGENHAPQISSTPPASVALGQSYIYAVVASDPDGDPLSLVLTTAPAGMSIIGSTVQWTPVPGQLGPHAVALVVADGRGGQASQAFTVEVLDEDGGENRPPTITSTPPAQAKVSFPYSYSVQAFDPDGDNLAWSLSSAPAGMTVDGAGVIRWTPTATGSVNVIVRVADAEAWVEQGWIIEVVAADVALSAAVTVAPDPVLPGEPVTISLDVEGAAGPVDVTATLDDTPLELPPEGAVTVLAPATPGNHAIEVTISDGADTVLITESFIVADPSDDTAPIVRLIAPLLHPDYDAVEISAPTAITGEVVGDDVAHWTLGVQERGGSAVRVLAEGEGAFAPGAIAEFDPTLLLNGQYHLVLQAWDAAGNFAFDSRILRVTGDMKLGHFSISFEEVSIPVAGIPVTVTRTYDTRRAHQSLDFGFGWTVDANNLRVQESRRPGYAWDVYEEGGLFGQRCIRPMGDPIVTVALPDGELASFKAQAEPECRSKFDLNPYVQLVFTPIDGTDHALEQTSYGTLRWGNVMGYPVPILFEESSGDTSPVDPRHYRLTTVDGLVYDIDQFEGVKRVFDTATETSLTYSREGVLHSSGIGITFVRDAAGRISQMQLPDGHTIDYAYSLDGDLLNVTDPAGATSQFGYIADPRYPHYLEDIVDGRGVRVSRNEYDETGRLVATIDADGNRVSFEHLIAERIEHVRDRNGNLTVYAYDEQGRVVQETNALGETIQRSYDDEGNQLSETNALGETTSWTYDSRGNRLTETNAAGETTTSAWNAKNQLLTELDPAGVPVVVNTYDTRSGLLLMRTEDALGQATSFTYVGGAGVFGTGQLESISDATGAATTFDYDPFTGHLRSETDALGRRTEYVRDSMGRVVEEHRVRTLADGSTELLTTSYSLDAMGRVVATEHPDGSITTVAYDPNGNPVEECDGLDRCTLTVYDARGNVASIEYPDGTSESKTYDSNGNLASETDRAGRKTTYVYDAANRLVETIHPDDTPGTDTDNPRTRSEYDAANRLVISIDELGRVTTYDYDVAGRQIAVTDPLGNTIQTEYDANGRRAAVVDPAGHRTEYVYDAVGRLIETRHDDGSSERLEYDAAGRKVADIDAMGRITRYAYDPLSRLVAVVLPDPVTGANPPLVNGASPEPGALTTRYVYDELGNKIAQIDAEGRETRWEYDPMGRETARTLPLGQREAKRYNLAGELVEHTDFKGQTTRYAYDAAGRLAGIDYPNDANVAFAYSPTGMRTAAIDARGTSTTDHDARDRLVFAHDADGFDIAYEYDTAGNLVARISPSQSLVYSYDDANRIVSVVRSIDGEAPITTSYEYDADGNRSAMVTGDGIRTEYTYDRRHRLTDLVKRTAAGALMAAMTYSVDASGMRTQVVETDAAGTTRTVVWDYDGVKRLVGETIDHRDDWNDRQAAWTYDRVGNRLIQSVTVGGTDAAVTTYVYDANDRLLEGSTTGVGASDVTTYTYDGNGSTLEQSGSGGAITYTWNDANRLVGVDLPGSTVSYVYNADGLRVRKTHMPVSDTPTTTWFVQDSVYEHAQAVEEYTGSSGTPLEISTSSTFVDGLVLQTNHRSSDAPATQFLHQDGSDSTRWITGTNGSAVGKVGYDAFGNELQRSGPLSVMHLYRSEHSDESTGLYYLRARWMDSSTGRFTSVDPFVGMQGLPISTHKYIYANADPVNGSDPSGYVAMMSLSSGVTTAAILTASAIAATKILQSAVGDATYGRHWGVWDALAAMAFRTLTLSMPGLQVGVQAKPRQRNPNDRHHTVPIYLCGHDDQDRSHINRTLHHELHAGLGGVAVALETAEQRADKIAPLGRRRSDPILNLADTRQGRAIIGGALESFYEAGWWWVGSPHIGAVFPSEKRLYIEGKTSLPKCKRKR